MHQLVFITSSLVNDVLRDLPNEVVFVYLDDILIFYCSLDEHIAHVCDVLHRLFENRLLVKAEKCELHAETMSFLVYVEEKSSLREDPVKVEAVKGWPVPTSHKELKRILGFAHFYLHFICNYSHIAAQLFQLTSGKVSFTWSDKANASFE